MQRLRTVTSLDVSAVTGHHATPAALLFVFNIPHIIKVQYIAQRILFIIFLLFISECKKLSICGLSFVKKSVLPPFCLNLSYMMQKVYLEISLGI